MQHLEVSGAVRPLKWSLGVKWLRSHHGMHCYVCSWHVFVAVWSQSEVQSFKIGFLSAHSTLPWTRMWGPVVVSWSQKGSVSKTLAAALD